MCIAIVIADEELIELYETFQLIADSPDPNVHIINNATVIILKSVGRWSWIIVQHTYNT